MNILTQQFSWNISSHSALKINEPFRGIYDIKSIYEWHMQDCVTIKIKNSILSRYHLVQRQIDSLLYGSAFCKPFYRIFFIFLYSKLTIPFLFTKAFTETHLGRHHPSFTIFIFKISNTSIHSNLFISQIHNTLYILLLHSSPL